MNYDKNPSSIHLKPSLEASSVVVKVSTRASILVRYLLLVLPHCNWFPSIERWRSWYWHRRWRNVIWWGFVRIRLTGARPIGKILKWVAQMHWNLSSKPRVVVIYACVRSISAINVPGDFQEIDDVRLVLWFVSFWTKVTDRAILSHSICNG